MVFDLIRTAKVFQRFLNFTHSPLAHLKPRLKIAGSIVEGTCLGWPDELDITIEYLELTPEDIQFDKTALKLMLKGRGQSK